MSISPLQTSLVVGISNTTLAYGILVAADERELKSGLIALGVGIVSGSLAFTLAELL